MNFHHYDENSRKLIEKISFQYINSNITLIFSILSLQVLVPSKMSSANQTIYKGHLCPSDLADAIAL